MEEQLYKIGQRVWFAGTDRSDIVEKAELVGYGTEYEHIQYGLLHSAWYRTHQLSPESFSEWYGKFRERLPEMITTNGP